MRGARRSRRRAGTRSRPDLHAAVQAAGENAGGSSLTRATAAFKEGSEAGATADRYVRTTVLLATILFLVGLSTHFPLQSVRYGLVGFGAVLLIVSAVRELVTFPDFLRERLDIGSRRAADYGFR